VLAAQIDIADWYGDRFLPAQAGEGKNHRHIAKARLDAGSGMIGKAGRRSLAQKSLCC